MRYTTETLTDAGECGAEYLHSILSFARHRDYRAKRARWAQGRATMYSERCYGGHSNTLLQRTELVRIRSATAVFEEAQPTPNGTDSILQQLTTQAGRRMSGKT